MTTEWEDIALPALRQIHAWEDDEDALNYSTRSLAHALGIDNVDRVGRQLEALEQVGYIEMVDARAGGGNHYQYIGLKVTAVGRRVLGEWPNDAMTALLNAVENTISQHLGRNDEKRLKKLRRLLHKMSPEVVRALVRSAAEAAF